MNESDFQRLEVVARLAAQPGVLKMLRWPLRLGYSKWLEICARQAGKGVERQAQTFWGDRIIAVFPERVSMTVYRYGFFEKDLTQALIRYLRPGMVFFDIGAHIGYFSLLAARLVGAEGRVHAFEPTPSTFEVLRKNLKERSNVVINNSAVFLENGSVSLTDFGVEYSAFNTLSVDKLKPEERTRVQTKQVEVPAVSVDRYVQETGVRPGFVKIDAEGSEIHILGGMEETLRDVRPLLSIEVGDISTSPEATASRAVVEFLLDRGYRAIEYRGGTETEHVLRDLYTHTNLLFLPV